MNNINKDNNIELIEFLNQEKLNKKIGYKKMYTFYNKCILKSIIELDIKFKTIYNKNISLINGINMIYYIFFILIYYTNNIKLTIFLIERSILFYSEFIIMSQDKKLIDQICFIPNVNDALFFTYKKTIGPIKLSNIKIKKDQQYIKDISNFMNNIYKDIISTKINYIEYITLLQKDLSLHILNICLVIENSNDKIELYNLIIELLNKDKDHKQCIILTKIFIVTIVNKIKKKQHYDINKIFNLINEYKNDLKYYEINNLGKINIYKILNI